MKKSRLFLSIVLLGLTANVWAGKSDQAIITEATKNKTTVAEAIKAADATAVNVTGTIVRHVKDDHFELKDHTGSIQVEIDHDLATVAQLKSGTEVKIYGEVDTHRIKPTDIEVVKIEILK
ncbi:MAG: NirD/YgiW/YdeI family stress tolerance protein [Candidatus Acinetobacter avistercoris]|uniref:NirD/YgiW/YdeI family stress tolerance protein n=1 Tax=Acinetobacter sp. KS-LM10 TaxID=3120518 RepID=UPI001F94963E|nr:NirD/YgiW/YdeI family stress tolerance protein [Candidatus Acinetobacter avistercoris]